VDDVKNLEGFLNALSELAEGALPLVDDASAFEAAIRAIEKLLIEDWPTIKAASQRYSLSASDRQRLTKVLGLINMLETKTQARLAWSRDFEAHMRSAMETTT
jgi:hypothetical protein